MPKVKFVFANGDAKEVDIPIGTSIMQGAIDNSVDEILGECGSACACATFHCYVDEDWIEKTGSAGEFEEELLEMVMEPKPTSRLSCQIEMTEELEGLVIHLPEEQG